MAITKFTTRQMDAVTCQMLRIKLTSGVTSHVMKPWPLRNSDGPKLELTDVSIAASRATQVSSYGFR